MSSHDTAIPDRALKSKGIGSARLTTQSAAPVLSASVGGAQMCGSLLIWVGVFGTITKM